MKNETTPILFMSIWCVYVNRSHISISLNFLGICNGNDGLHDGQGASEQRASDSSAMQESCNEKRHTRSHLHQEIWRRNLHIHVVSLCGESCRHAHGCPTSHVYQQRQRQGRNSSQYRHFHRHRGCWYVQHMSAGATCCSSIGAMRTSPFCMPCADTEATMDSCCPVCRMPIRTSWSSTETDYTVITNTIQ